MTEQTHLRLNNLKVGDFPGSQSSGYDFAFQCGFNPWSGKQDSTCFAAKRIKQMQYSNKFNKDINNVFGIVLLGERFAFEVFQQ